MTAAQTVTAFSNYIDQYSTARVDDVDFWINEGIFSFVKQRLKRPLNNPTAGFQLNQRIRDELAKIIKTDVTLSFVNGVATYPSDCFELIPDSIACKDLDIAKLEGGYLYARPRSYSWLFANKHNPFSKPRLKQGRLIYIESSTGISIFPIHAFTEVRASYIMDWPRFSSVTDPGPEVPIYLHSKTHIEITRIAASKYLMAVGNDDGAKILLQQNILE